MTFGGKQHRLRTDQQSIQQHQRSKGPTDSTTPKETPSEADRSVQNAREHEITWGQGSKNSPWSSPPVVLVRKRTGTSDLQVAKWHYNKRLFPTMLDWQHTGHARQNQMVLNIAYEERLRRGTAPWWEEESRATLSHSHVMTFGLCIAPATFERLMQTVIVTGRKSGNTCFETPI
jgi:hypothetical protein